MKKKNLKSLDLNKKVISNIEDNKIIGGTDPKAGAKLKCVERSAKIV